MKTYLVSATAVIFLSVIVSLVIPEGKLNKTIVFVMRMACIFVLIQPITGIFKIKSSFADYNFYDYEYICKVYSDNQSEQLEKIISEEFSIECTCYVNIVYKEEKFTADGVIVQINKTNEEIIEEIYEYLEKLNYINISVYAKSD